MVLVLLAVFVLLVEALVVVLGTFVRLLLMLPPLPPLPPLLPLPRLPPLPPLPPLLLTVAKTGALST